jgi:hypothetical protein
VKIGDYRVPIQAVVREPVAALALRVLRFLVVVMTERNCITVRRFLGYTMRAGMRGFRPGTSRVIPLMQVF